ncbi:MAG TPA: 3-hydroxyacyl-ACP dehydratase FabZ [Terriglobales bacterium]|nr:3-hydroxyacyl-ACP dehydratase FabZ [Terriglobales bacterium]
MERGLPNDPQTTELTAETEQTALEASSAGDPVSVPQVAESAIESPKKTLNISEIQAILPHRYPFLLIDRVIDMERKQRIVALKNVTINEPFFAGHFPGFPIMPGVLIIEAIAQAGGALLLTEVEDRDNKLMVFTGIERAKFRRPVVPGDQLRIEVEVVTWRRTAVRMQGKAYVDGKVAAEAVVTCRLVPRKAGALEGASEEEN